MGWGRRRVPFGDHGDLCAAVLDQGFQAVQFRAGGDEGLRGAAAAATAAAAAAACLQQRLLERTAAVLSAELRQQNRLTFQAGLCALGGQEWLDGCEQVHLLEHHVLVFWAQQNHVGLTLTLDPIWDEVLLLVQGRRHDDFELRVAVRGERVGRHGKRSVAL